MVVVLTFAVIGDVNNHKLDVVCCCCFCELLSFENFLIENEFNYDSLEEMLHAWAFSLR